MYGLDCYQIRAIKWHSVGDEVVLIGKQGKEEISVNEIAEKAETIPYEILTRIGKRVKRLYKEKIT